MDRLLANTACAFIKCVKRQVYALEYGIDCNECDCLFAYGRYKSVKSSCDYDCVKVEESVSTPPQTINCEFIITENENPDSCGVFSLSI